MRDRFKAICVCKNMHELGLPKYIEACNGKPILLKHTANYYRGDGYVNIDINMHRCVMAPGVMQKVGLPVIG